MKSINDEGNLKRAMLAAASVWEKDVPDHIRYSSKLEDINNYFNLLMKPYNGRIRIALRNDKEIWNNASDVEVLLEFDTKEDESFFILKWC